MFERRRSAGSTSSTSGPVNRLPQLLVLVGLLAQVDARPCLADDGPLRRIADLATPVERRVPFVELRMNRLLRKPAEQRGTVWVGADGALVMRIEEPFVEERRLHEGQLSLRRLPPGDVTNVETALAQARLRTMKLDLGQSAHAAVAALADVLRGDVASLERRFTMSAAPANGDKEDDWAIELVPTDAKLRRALGHVLLRGRGTHLAGLEVGHGPKKWRKMRFLPIAPNTSADATP